MHGHPVVRQILPEFLNFFILRQCGLSAQYLARALWLPPGNFMADTFHPHQFVRNRTRGKWFPSKVYFSQNSRSYSAALPVRSVSVVRCNHPLQQKSRARGDRELFADLEVVRHPARLTYRAATSTLPKRKAHRRAYDQFSEQVLHNRTAFGRFPLR